MIFECHRHIFGLYVYVIFITIERKREKVENRKRRGEQKINKVTAMLIWFAMFFQNKIFFLAHENTFDEVAVLLL